MSTPARPGIYARGAEAVDQILKAARDVLIDEGAAAFTFRRIAARCDMKVGNISYHFPRKEALVQLLLDELLISYRTDLDRMVRRPEMSAAERLERLITILLDDIGSKRTTHLFTELWALSNHNPAIADRVAAFYAQAHRSIGQFVAELNPALDEDEVQAVALFISASMEGTTPFLGFGKAWAHRMPWIKGLAVKSLLHLARSVTPEDIRAFA